jgi:SSS family solute:Na+ symporter
MFWKGCNAQGAFAMLIISVLANIALKFITPDLAFVIRIWIVFLACLVVGYVASTMAKADTARAIELSGMNFVTTRGFNRSASALVLILVGIYAYFW